MKIIKHREMVETSDNRRSFHYENCPGAGFSFPCNHRGIVDVAALNPAAFENYQKCVQGYTVINGKRENIIDDGLQVLKSRYMDPAIGVCDCGAEVILDSFTNTCDGCEADYNMSGQMLADRRFWGEETGESLADIERIR